MRNAYLADEVFTGTEWLQNHAVVVEDDTVSAVLPAAEIKDRVEWKEYTDGLLVPAFIDVQIYGAHKKLLAVYPESQSLQLLYDYCSRGGATLFLPTVATNHPDVFHRCIDAVRAYWAQGGKGVWGLHLEGPWINAEKRGAHAAEFIHTPTVEEAERLLNYGEGVIKMITLAPERCSKEVIRLILSRSIVVSAGHSNATYEEATKSFENGISVVTHLYNAMSPLQHRNPGLVGAVFNHPGVKASIIPDGHHVDWAAIQIAKKIMGDRLFVITDAVTETTEGYYHHQLEGDKYVSKGILSGSALTMHKAFYNLVNKLNIEVEEALRMCSLYPAQVLGCDNLYGKIAPGYAAQFIVLDNGLRLVDVITGQR